MVNKIYFRYPYGIRTFVKTAREEGLAQAMSDDWAMTKRDVEETVLEVAIYAAVTLAVPIMLGVYVTKHIVDSARQKLRNDSLEVL